MNIPILSKIIFTTVLLLISVATLAFPIGDVKAQIADGPWPIFHHDLQHTGRSPNLGAQTNNVRWSYTTGGTVRSSPAIGSDGTVYVGSNDGKLYAINPNGTQKWNYPTGGDVGSSPAIGSDGTLYVGSNDAKHYAINPDGSLKWSSTTGGNSFSSPAIGTDGTVYVGSGDNKLYAYNASFHLIYIPLIVKP